LKRFWKWLKGKFRRTKRISYGTHIYIGPTTRWGLVNGAGCNLYPFIKKKSGLITIKTIDGQSWQVAPEHIQQRGVK
jgi:hypothetical protein